MQPRIALIAGGIAAAIAIILAAFFFLSGDDSSEEQVTETVVTEPVVQQPLTGPETDAAGTVPSFDIVRVERDGMAVIAGRAEPGATVTLKSNGNAIATIQADNRGEWVIVLDEPLAPGDIELSLSAVSPSGESVDSIQTVSVSVPRQETGQALVVLSEPGRASRVLQGPGVPSDAGSLVLEAVDYDEDGNVIISGSADAGAIVRIYLNGSPIGDAPADRDGNWELRPGGSVAPGTYNMRIDQLDDAGQVTARVEVPFERGVPEEVRAALANGKIVIQPGNNLWNIARQIYGSGYRYTVIYQANRDQIRDPDLIYPGQIFTTPN